MSSMHAYNKYPAKKKDINQIRAVTIRYIIHISRKSCEVRYHAVVGIIILIRNTWASVLKCVWWQFSVLVHHTQIRSLKLPVSNQPEWYHSTKMCLKQHPFASQLLSLDVSLLILSQTCLILTYHKNAIHFCLDYFWSP